MKTYFSFFRMRFLTLIQYRVAALAGVATQWVFGMMKVLVLCAFYAGSDAAQPMSLAQSVTYVWIGQAMLATQPWDTEREIMNSVLTGQVAYELTRPVDLYSMWYMRTLALRTAPTILKAVPQFIIALFIIPAPWNMIMPGPEALAAWLFAIFCGILLSCAMTNLMHSIVLHTVRAEGFVRFLPTLSMFMSGMIVPLKLLPDAAQVFMRVQPFAGLMDLPSQLFCGSLAPADVWWVAALQLGWTLAFVVLGRVIVRAGIKKVSVAGG